MSQQHTLYFSKRCRFCQAFLEALSQTTYTSEIRFFCVDPSPSRPPLPAWLKSVPALVVQGKSEPLVGPSAVNNWLFERKLLGAGGASSGGGSGRAGVAPPPYSVPPLQPRKSNALPEPISSATAATSKQGPPSLAGGADGPEAWHAAEMAGGQWSDNYSFLGDTFSSEKGLNPIVRNFESLAGPVGMPGAGGGGGGGGGSKPQQPRSAKEEKLLNDFEAYSKSREMEFSGPKRIG